MGGSGAVGWGAEEKRQRVCAGLGAPPERIAVSRDTDRRRRRLRQFVSEIERLRFTADEKTSENQQCYESNQLQFQNQILKVRNRIVVVN